jgi:hypothetical protein
MGFLDKLFKPKAQSEEDANRSVEMMERLKQRRGQETGKWLTMMEHASEAPPELGPPSTIEDVDKRQILDEAPYSPPIESRYMALSPDQSGRNPTAPATPHSEVPTAQHNETADWVNLLFAEFSRQAAAYNASAAGTDLVLTVRPPEFSYEAPHYGQAQEPQTITVFKGHIATSHWAMLVQGYEDKIDIYVISADEILNFTMNDIRKSQVTPFMMIESSVVNSHRVWSVGGTAIGAETIPHLAKELLGDLVRIATGSMSEAELFADHSTELKLGETVAQGYSPQQPIQQTTDEQPNTVRDQIDMFATWSACNALLKALDSDLTWVTSKQGAIEPEKDQETAKYLHDLSAALRTLSGQVDGLLANYHPAAGSKYNPS